MAIACESYDSWLLRWSPESLPNWAKGAQPSLKGDMLVAVEIRFPSFPAPVTANAFSAPMVQAGVDFAAKATEANVDQAHKQLLGKYGKPTSWSMVTFDNHGRVVREVKNMEWILPGLHVKYTAGSYEDTVTIELASIHESAETTERNEEQARPSL